MQAYTTIHYTHLFDCPREDLVELVEELRVDLSVAILPQVCGDRNAVVIRPRFLFRWSRSRSGVGPGVGVGVEVGVAGVEVGVAGVAGVGRPRTGSGEARVIQHGANGTVGIRTGPFQVPFGPR